MTTRWNVFFLTWMPFWSCPHRWRCPSCVTSYCRTQGTQSVPTRLCRTINKKILKLVYVQYKDDKHNICFQSDSIFAEILYTVTYRTLYTSFNDNYCIRFILMWLITKFYVYKVWKKISRYEILYYCETSCVRDFTKSVLLKGIVFPDWKGLHMFSLIDLKF
jgi:hypothetical protein